MGPLDLIHTAAAANARSAMVTHVLRVDGIHD